MNVPPREAARPLASALAIVGLLALGGCQPSIGDRCVLSTDCSQRGDRLCDTSQPGGYCTIFNCVGNGCPTEASCVIFGGKLPGCAYSDRGVARTARSFCVATCTEDLDCRVGYRCRDPHEQDKPWSAIVLDDLQTRRICLPETDAGAAAAATESSSPAPVCGSQNPPVPPIDAEVPRDGSLEAGPPDSGSDSGGPDAGTDAAGDAGRDAGTDAADSG